MVEHGRTWQYEKHIHHAHKKSIYFQVADVKKYGYQVKICRLYFLTTIQTPRPIYYLNNIKYVDERIQFMIDMLNKIQTTRSINS